MSAHLEGKHYGPIGVAHVPQWLNYVRSCAVCGQLERLEEPASTPPPADRDTKLQEDYAEASKLRDIDWDDWELAWMMGEKYGRS